MMPVRWRPALLAAALAAAGCGTRKSFPVLTIESWETPAAVAEWKAWDTSASVFQDTTIHADGVSGLALQFDGSRYRWPLAMKEFFPTPISLKDADVLCVEAWVPEDMPSGLAFQFGVKLSPKHGSPPVALHHGWNSVRADLHGSWLPATGLDLVTGLELIIKADQPTLKGRVVFDNLRTERFAN